MRGAYERLPVPLSIAAIAIAGLGVTRAGDAATGPRGTTARFAFNAGSVNGIRASRVPRAGRLLALGPGARYPRSVVPATVGPDGPQGAQGAPGPPGPTGRPGGDVVLARTNEGIAYPANYERVTLLELPNLDAGNWLLLGASGSGTPRFGPYDFSCHITRGAVDLAGSTATTGRGAGGGRFSDHLAVTAVALRGPATLRLRCAHTGETQAIAEAATLAAIRVGRLEQRKAEP